MLIDIYMKPNFVYLYLPEEIILGQLVQTNSHNPNEIMGTTIKSSRKIFPIHHLALIRKPLSYFIVDVEYKKGTKDIVFMQVDFHYLDIL